MKKYKHSVEISQDEENILIKEFNNKFSEFVHTSFKNHQHKKKNNFIDILSNYIFLVLFGMFILCLTFLSIMVHIWLFMFILGIGTIITGFTFIIISHRSYKKYG